jgi:16S rRNA (uracil1498-N3)-methyltransferase
VDRRDRASVATFFADAVLARGASIELSEEAAQHARVRRIEVGAEVRIANGRGSIAHGILRRLTKAVASVQLDEVTDVAPAPPLRLFVPVADRDRMLWLAEKSAELAVTEWQPVVFRRSLSVTPRGEGDGFRRKVRARMIGALEQSGGAWLPEIHAELPLADALVRSGDLRGERFLMDVAGSPLMSQRATAASVMIGPEGGLDEAEREMILDAHRWLPVSLGETTLRFETAGVVAAGILRGFLAANQ